VQLGLVKVQEWVGLINQIMNVSSWIVLKSNHSYQRIGYWKAWCGNRTVTRKSYIGLRLGGLYICAVGLDILKFEQTSLFYWIRRIGALFRRS